MTEAVVYNRLAHDGFKMRFFNDIICIYEYRDDGLTKAGNKLFLDNPKGYGLWLREKADYMNFTVFRRVKLWYSFYCDFASDKHSINHRRLAEMIHAPKFVMDAFALYYRLKHGVEKNDASC